jgi:hypothetical protein
VRDLDQFKPGDGVQVSYTQKIIAMAENSDEGTARVAKYGTVDVEPEGDKLSLGDCRSVRETRPLASGP